MGRASLKDNKPIPLPHDGPIHVALQKEGRDPALSSAVTLLRDAASIDVGSSSSLLAKLAHAKTVKDQLQLLQAYRSTLLQTKSLSDDVDPLVLYRILLEWSVSCQTPVALRRALQSVLSSLATLVDNQERVAVDMVVVESLGDDWQQPLSTLKELLGYEPISLLLLDQERLLSQVLSFLWSVAEPLLLILLDHSRRHNESAQMMVLDQLIVETIEQSVVVANLSKTLLKGSSTLDDPELQTAVTGLRQFLTILLHSRAVPTDCLLVIGVARARAELWGAADAFLVIDDMLASADNLAETNAAALMQGVAAAVPDSCLFAEDDWPVLKRLMGSFRSLALTAVDPDVRLIALKGIRTLVARCSALQNDRTVVDSSCRAIDEVIDQTLEVVLSAWENPPTRKLGNSIPALFGALVALIRQQNTEASFRKLLERVLMQPPNRKGRYVALETLLPETGAQALFQAVGSVDLFRDLLSGVGDHGHNTVAISDLWAKILGQLLVEMKAAAGVADDSARVMNRKQRRKMTRDAHAAETPSDPPRYQYSKVLDAWASLWLPSLAEALVADELSRSKQVSAFCLPRIVNAVGGPSFRGDAACTCRKLLLRLSHNSLLPVSRPASAERLSVQDRVLWAQCEVSAFSLTAGLLDASSAEAAPLRECIATILTTSRQMTALMHTSAALRRSAFQAIEAAVVASNVHSIDRLRSEIKTWVAALPCAIKNGDKDYTSSILSCLLSLFDRLSVAETVDVGDRVNVPLPLLREFVVDFILDNVFVRQAAYPGTVVDKACFALSLLECVIVFSCREHSLALSSKLLPKTGAIFQRRRGVPEEKTMATVRAHLLSEPVISAVFALLFSNWDNVRGQAYLLLSALVRVGRHYSLALPQSFGCTTARLNLSKRGMFLASSPRQREADTGARILSCLNLSASEDTERLRHVEDLLELLEQRIGRMRETLSAILNDDLDLTVGVNLPLAHGIIQSLGFSIENGDFESVDPQLRPRALKLLDVTGLLFNRSLRLSMSVVADVRDGDVVEGLDEHVLCSDTAPDGIDRRAKINPGAIGANGIFSSVKRTNKQERARRIASQRIVVGAWLLTKEACSAMASLLSRESLVADLSLYEETGMLLISTLTSLKHTGAAFAAHRALEKVAKACFESSYETLRILPVAWSSRLLREISELDKVKNSTLRRSTGYALGFLSVMRAELASRTAPKCLALKILSEILRLSLPCEAEFRAFLGNNGYLKDELFSVFSFLGKAATVELVEDDRYETRTRVHALNILRLIILDAPLSQVVFPMVGDAIISAIMGYVNNQWHVRNSATMVFAASMLRVVDADKNASNTGTTSSSAVTVSELFQSYPSLQRYLAAVLDQAVKMGRTKDESDFSFEPVLPILLLLSRVQPVANSGGDALSLAAPFLPSVCATLGHPNLGIRRLAAKALANISTGDEHVTRPPHSALENNLLNIVTPSIRWNKRHGAFLAIHSLVKVGGLTNKGMTSQDRILDTLLAVADNLTDVPPVCQSAMIDILDELEPMVLTETRVDDLCLRIVGRIEEPLTMEIPGLPELGLKVGAYACRRIATKVWDAGEVCNTEAVRRVQPLLRLFRSSAFDVSCSAVKAFKKTIYEGLDGLSLGSVDTGRSIVESLVDVLTEALQFEMDRRQSTSNCGGLHEPTLRRLSRCLLECLYALESLGGHESLGDRIEAILRLSSAMVPGDDIDLDHATPLHGNVAEMLAIVVKTPRYRDDETLGSLRKLVVVLSHPSVSWRLRHSAATALQASRLVEWQHEIVSAETREVFTQALMRLLQDPDDDVRHAASRAVGRSIVLSSDILLRETSAINASVLGRSLFTETAFSSMLDSTADLDKRIFTMITDLEAVEKTDGTSDIVNTDASRNIFEEENPNSYIEQSLIDQVTLVDLVGLETFAFTDKQQYLSEKLVGRCKATLVAILARVKEASAFFDVTRESQIMTPLHSLVLVCAAIVYLGRKDDEGLGQLAEDIGSHAILHPIMAEAMDTLASARPADEATRQKIKSACFLAPRYQICSC